MHFATDYGIFVMVGPVGGKLIFSARSVLNYFDMNLCASLQ